MAAKFDQLQQGVQWKAKIKLTILFCWFITLDKIFENKNTSSLCLLFSFTKFSIRSHEWFAFSGLFDLLSGKKDAN